MMFKGFKIRVLGWFNAIFLPNHPYQKQSPYTATSEYLIIFVVLSAHLGKNDYFAVKAIILPAHLLNVNFKSCSDEVIIFTSISHIFMPFSNRLQTGI